MENLAKLKDKCNGVVVIEKDDFTRKWCADVHWADGSIWKRWCYDFRTKKGLTEYINEGPGSHLSLV